MLLILLVLILIIIALSTKRKWLRYFKRRRGNMELTIYSTKANTLFWALYLMIAFLSFIGTWIPEHPGISLIKFGGSLIVWYFLLRLVFRIVIRILKELFKKQN